jgi:hypothetical protein
MGEIALRRQPLARGQTARRNLARDLIGDLDEAGFHPRPALPGKTELH